MTTETSKLKIVTTVTHTENVDKEIDLPYYFKSESGGFIYKVVSEDLAIEVCTLNKYWGASICPKIIFIARIANGTPISEFEFDAALSKAQMYVDLINRNEAPLKEEDENLQIEQQLINRQENAA